MTEENKPAKPIRKKARSGVNERHAFLTHFVEPLRREHGAKQAAVRLREWLNDMRQFLADEPTDHKMILDAYDEEGTFAIEISHAMELAERYAELYAEEADIQKAIKRSTPSSPLPKAHRINWIGTYTQFRKLLELLAEEHLVDANVAKTAPMVFFENCLKDGELPNRDTVRSAMRPQNHVKYDDEERLSRIVKATDTAD